MCINICQNKNIALVLAMCSLVPRPCTFVACSTKFTLHFVLQCEFHTASDKRQGLGTRLYCVAM